MDIFWSFFFSFIAMAIALLAIYLTMKQIEMSREHNRLSVRPHLTFESCTNNVEGLIMGVMLKNNGIGPAIIKNYKLIWMNKTNVEGHVNINMFIKEQLKNVDDAVWGVLAPETPIAVNQEIWLFKIELDKKNKTNTAHFSKFLKSLNIVIDYESIYGDKIFNETWMKPL